VGVCGLVIFLLLGKTATASQYAFEVWFTDKNNTPYSFSSPLTYLSPRALARRSAQGIAIDSTDLPVNPTYVDSVIALTGGTLHETSRWLNMCMVLLSDSSQILNLGGKPFIKNIKLVGYYSSGLHRSTGTTSGGSLSGTGTNVTTSGGASYYGNTWTQTHLVNGNYLHDLGYMGQGKLIAVLDAGFIGTDSHPAFDSMWTGGRVVDTFDFVFHNSSVFMQDNHGTEVLSTIAGNVPGTFVGSAPYASFALYVTEYNGGDQPLEMDNMLCAAERADSLGADIITESVGYDLFDYPPGAGQNFSTDLDGKTTIAAQAANIATKKGMLFVATAGNDGQGYLTWGNHILTPGDADSALTIGAVDGSGNIAAFSGYGPNAAGQVKPDVCAMGFGAYTVNASGGYATPMGTSISTPQVAGWAACLWQAHPAATPYKIKDAIRKCASSYSSPGVQLGYGVPDFQCTDNVVGIKNLPLAGTANWVAAVPNPFSNEIILSVTPDAQQTVDFHLTDMTGREVATLHAYLRKGYNAPVSFSIPQLPAGVYMLKAVSPTQTQVLKLEKE
jgi:serine protease AprX